MDMQKLEALGVFRVVYFANTPGADVELLKAPKYRESGGATGGGNAKVDPESEWEIVGYQFSGDTAGKFWLANASGGLEPARVGPTAYYPNNHVSPLIECKLPVGKGLPIIMSGTPTGNFSIVLYVVDRNYKSMNRVTPGT